jgi:hypothetical protein
MDWITLKLMKYQLKKAKKQLTKQEHSFTKRAFGDMVKFDRKQIMCAKAKMQVLNKVIMSFGVQD